MKKIYIIPKTRIQAVDPETIMAGTKKIKVSNNTDDKIEGSEEAGWGKINYNAWEDDFGARTYLPDFDESLTPYSY